MKIKNFREFINESVDAYSGVDIEYMINPPSQEQVNLTKPTYEYDLYTINEYGDKIDWVASYESQDGTLEGNPNSDIVDIIRSHDLNLDDVGVFLTNVIPPQLDEDDEYEHVYAINALTQVRADNLQDAIDIYIDYLEENEPGMLLTPEEEEEAREEGTLDDLVQGGNHGR
jgi:hypothetical protein